MKLCISVILVLQLMIAGLTNTEVEAGHMDDYETIAGLPSPEVIFEDGHGIAEGELRISNV